ncbi:hypothetical protein Acr_11g0010790 [Actinidia rufa]|uniref:Uncharacterized protein n=1 Tax=Actinidia rufa TaxID=165716 RepID=A0A7J0FDV8_9ERIC|nr:hypothetical protein Acr_11g0010790 [Actinidia rufa]
MLSIMARDLLTLLTSTMPSETRGEELVEPGDTGVPNCLKDWDDAKYRIQHEVTEKSYILEPFKIMDLLDDEENEGNN